LGQPLGTINNSQAVHNCLTTEVEPDCLSEASVTNYKSVLCNIPEGRISPLTVHMYQIHFCCYRANRMKYVTLHGITVFFPYILLNIHHSKKKNILNKIVVLIEVCIVLNLPVFM